MWIIDPAGPSGSSSARHRGSRYSGPGGPRARRRTARGPELEVGVVVHGRFLAQPRVRRVRVLVEVVVERVELHAATLRRIDRTDRPRQHAACCRRSRGPSRRPGRRRCSTARMRPGAHWSTSTPPATSRRSGSSPAGPTPWADGSFYAADVPYTTRLLARRPADPDRASGTVHLEPLHVLGEGAPTWGVAHTQILRRGTRGSASP